MREIRIVTFVVDSADPGSDVDKIIEDGAEAQGYSAEEYQASNHIEAYWKVRKI